MMKSLRLVVFAVFLVLVAAGSSGSIRSVHARTASSSTLSVVGNHLVDNGSVVVLRGVNRSGAEYACFQGWGFMDGPADDASIAAITAWSPNINAVRVPFNEDCWLGINGIPAAYAGANYQAWMVGFVSRLRAHGLYVILDNQFAGPGTTKSTTILPMPDADHAPTMWSSVASTFAGDKGVIFDLYNEPHDVSWSCWANGCQVTGGVNFVSPYQAAGMNSLTAAVRSTGATNVIMIGGLSWAYDLSGWLANRPNDGQLMGSIHNYGASGWDTPAIWDNIYAPIAAQVPATLGEMGFDGYVEKIMPWADAHGVGYLAWVWDTWGNSQALISNYNGTPTPYGQGFKNYLATLAAPPAISSLTPNSGPGAGGTSVTIAGTNLTGATAVKFGTAPATAYAVNSATQITATSPPGSGTVDVTVTTTAGTSAITAAGKFSYTAPPPLGTYVVGAVGSGNGLWVLHSGSPSFTGDGGVLLGAPAVVAIPQTTGPASPIYIATGSDHALYVRNDAQGWQILSGSPTYCIDNPAGAVIAGTLYVACEGKDQALWHAETPAPSGVALPTLNASSWHSLGGSLVAGPAVASVAGTPTYLVVETDQHVYSRDLVSPSFTRFSWACLGHPALATFSSTSYFACHGTDNALWYATNAGSGWSTPQSLGGTVVDGVGLAATSTGPVFFVEGVGGGVYHRSLSSGWTSDGGQVTLGVGACAL